ncbi:MAG: argininosuccinate lyase [Phycisphaerales bacterium]|nr:argininosuccinate lyase [Phycisphaerales bacterium]
MSVTWGGRFTTAADPIFREFNDSLSFDRTLVREDIEGSVGWACALERAGVLTEAELRSLVDALGDVLRHAIESPSSLIDAADEDIHSWVERELVARVGSLGKKLHTGRSRNDQVATDLRLWTLKQITARSDEIDGCIRSLIAVAQRERETVFPGYTHLQRAQPILFGHWCMAYVEMLLRDRERFADAAIRAGLCPLGSGALAGTAYPIDRVQLAHDLGFSGPTANSLDAVSDRDFVVETLAASTLASIHLSRLAEDLIFYSTGEAGLVELSDSVTSGSSLMPQKKNPDALELIRGKTGRQVANLVNILTVLKGLPLAYNKDLQEDKEPLFDSMTQLSLSLRMIPPVLDGIIVHRERARIAACGGYSNATELADYLVKQGIPFRDAHHSVGRLVREAIRESKPLEELSVAQMQLIEPSVREDVFVALTVDRALAQRDVVGGTAPSKVAGSIDAARRQMDPRHEDAPPSGRTTLPVTIREAHIDDLDAICAIIEHWAREGEHLPRSRDEILESLSEFAVAVDGDRVVGCGSLWIYTPQLAEIRSLGVVPGLKGGGLGSTLTRYFVDWAADLGIPKVFVLTRAPEFFARCGFSTVSVSILPEKVLKDCAKCPRNNACDEVAMTLDTGALPLASSAVQGPRS